jgi:transposase
MRGYPGALHYPPTSGDGEPWRPAKRQQQSGWKLEIIERQPGSRGFNVQPRRWIVGRSFAWLIRNRRLAKDYERKVQTSETLIEVAMVRFLIRRLAGPAMQRIRR